MNRSSSAALVQREQFFQELLQFEQSYADLLQHFVDVFVDRFRPKPNQFPIIPPFDFQIIFMVGISGSNNIRMLPIQVQQDLEPTRKLTSSRQKSMFEELRDLHTAFLQKLETATLQQSGRSKAIAETFAMLHQWYQPYAVYFGALDSTIKKVVALKAVRPVSEFHNVIEACERRFHERTGKFLALENALRIPFDHVSKYGDLLKRLYQLTNEIYSDLTLDLSDASERVKSFLTFANDFRGELDAISETIQLQRSIANVPINIDLLRQGGKRNEGQLRVGKSSQIYHGFLFDHTLLLCSTEPTATASAAANKRASRNLTFFRAFDLSDWSVEASDDTIGQDWAMGWSFVHRTKREPSVNICALDSLERTQWITWITRADNIVNPNSMGYHKLVYTSLIISTQTSLCQCTCCQKYIVNYGYICQYCGCMLHINCKDKYVASQIGYCPIGIDVHNRSKTANQNAPLWWGGVLNAKEAAKFLCMCTPGTFMVRYSEMEQVLRVSCTFNGHVLHMAIENGAKSLRLPGVTGQTGQTSSCKEFTSAAQLAEWLMMNSASTQIPYRRLV